MIDLSQYNHHNSDIRCILEGDLGFLDIDLACANLQAELIKLKVYLDNID